MPSAPLTHRPRRTTSAALADSQASRAHHRQQYDRQRGSSAARGYDGRWQDYRRAFFSHHVNVICGMCLHALAAVIDHVIAVDGPDDPLFYEPTNHLGLCQSCHRVKSAMVDGAMGNRRTVEGERLLARLIMVAKERAVVTPGA